MQNNYILEGGDSFSFQLEVERIIQEKKLEDYSIQTYDLSEVTFSSLLEEVDTYSFLNPQKVILVEHLDLLDDKEYKDDFEHFYRYLENPNLDYFVFFYFPKLAKTSTLAKKLKKYSTLISLTFEPRKYVEKELSSYQIDSNTISLLLEYCLDDSFKLRNEIEKLKMFAIDTKKITEKDIRDLVVQKVKDYTDTIFQFVTYILSKDKKKAFLEYEKLENFIDPYQLLGLFSSQIRFLYQVKLLEKNSNDEIASILGAHPYRVKKSRELVYSYKEKELLELMKELADIDYQMKTTDTDPKFLLQMFMIHL